MRILHIISYNGVGGAEVFTKELIRNMLMSKQVKFFHLLTFSNTYKNLNFNFKSNKFKHIHFYFPSNKLIFNFFPNSLYILNTLKLNYYDIVNSHLLTPLYVFIFPFFFRNIKFFHTIHSQAEKELGKSKFSIHFLIRKIYYYKSNLISISNSVSKSIFSIYNLKSHLIFNGCTYKEKTNYKIQGFIKKTNKKILLSVGNTRKVKNHKLLIEAFKENNKDAILIILGSLVDDFSDINIKSYEKNNIFFLGHVNNVQDYMKISDFLCVTSNYEGMPISILEAKANGLLPIVRPVNGIIDIVENNFNGLISEDLSLNSYSIALKKALKLSKINKSKMIKNLINEYNKIYNIKICTKNYLKLYKMLK